MALDRQPPAKLDGVVGGGLVAVADQPRVDAGERREGDLVAAVAADGSGGRRPRIGGGVNQP